MTQSRRKPSAALFAPSVLKNPVVPRAMSKTHMRKHPPTRRGLRPMYSHAISDEKIDTMSRTNVMIVTMKGSLMPAVLKKYVE